MRKKHKLLCCFLALSLLTGCGSSQTGDSVALDSTGQESSAVQESSEAFEESEVPESSESLESSESTENDDMVESTESAEESEATESVLIAYFTWADNTYVEDPSTVDVDATTSASVLAPGNVGLIAGWIHEEIGGDLFSIQVEELYSSNYDECLDRASEENADNARPALATHVENMDQYDTVYIGYPNWWYSCPMALLSFLEEYDFSGKHIVLFCSHGTGGLSGSVSAIRDVLPEDCEIEDNVLGVYRPEVADSQDEVLDWLSEVR